MIYMEKSHIFILVQYMLLLHFKEKMFENYKNSAGFLTLEEGPLQQNLEVFNYFN